jgi:hypothetical protein
MSQQEFDPQFQSQGDDARDEVYQPRTPYSWSGKQDQEAAPRDEPPASYGEFYAGYDQVDPYGKPYLERDTSGSYTRPNAGSGQQAGSDEDSKKYQRGYGPAGQVRGQAQGAVPTGRAGAGQGLGQGVPPWARPQQHRHAPFRFGFIILVLIIIALAQGLLANGGMFVGTVGGIAGAIIGIVLFVLIVPLIILVVFFGFLMRLFRSGGARNYRTRQRWRSRSWPNGPYWW